ncbi:MAG: hypothetical protein IKQ71_11075 [Lachnospiraceae bacterium]|nr:hypothetical protein [Lachnospiraceae bacterium]
MSLVQKKLSEDRVDGIADLISNIVNPVYREKAAEVTFGSSYLKSKRS